MNELFRAHKDITEADYDELWAKGLFIFDSNVLLDLYRLPESARRDLLDILSDKKLSDRIWLPFQVGLEFTHNKNEAISDQKSKFYVVKEILNKTITQIENLDSELKNKLEDLQLNKRHSVINPDPYVNNELFKPTVEKLNSFLEKLEELDRKQPDVNDKDNIKEQVSKIFDDKIGKPPSVTELEEIYKEGEIRYKEMIPPGYKDAKKDNFYIFEDKKFERKFGDLLLWKEIVKKAKNDKLEYIILVTGDSKEDWWQEKRGKKLGPRYELLNEIYFNSKNTKLFYIYDTSSFMQYAKQYLKININERSIVETKDLLESNQSLQQLSFIGNEVLAIKDVIFHERKFFPLLKVKLIIGFLPKLRVSYQDLHFMFFEIFSNVLNHSLDKSVFIKAKYFGNTLLIRFKNRLNEIPVVSENRGFGLSSVGNIMKKYGSMKVTKDEGNFKLELIFSDKFIVKRNDLYQENFEW